MKFYSTIPAEIFWDQSEKKALCAFSDGVYETTNSREIEILKQYYKFDGEVVVDEPDKIDTVSRIRKRTVDFSKKSD